MRDKLVGGAGEYDVSAKTTSGIKEAHSNVANKKCFGKNSISYSQEENY
jgi:hypothetical protein